MRTVDEPVRKAVDEVRAGAFGFGFFVDHVWQAESLDVEPLGECPGWRVR